jgi:hypothetical protein
MQGTVGGLNVGTVGGLNVGTVGGLNERAVGGLNVEGSRWTERRGQWVD